MSTEYSDGDYLYGADLDNLVESTAKNGVLTGLGVTENTPTPDMNVVVAAGNGFAGETYFNKATGTVVPITAAHATLDRLDLIVVNSSGTVSATAGTPATTPNPPDLADDSILLAIVDVGATATQIFNANITPKRLLLGTIQKEMVDSSIAVLSQTETVTAAWTFTGKPTFETDILLKDGSAVEFGGTTMQGRIYWDGTRIRIADADVILGSSLSINFGDGSDLCGRIVAESSLFKLKNDVPNTIFSFPRDAQGPTTIRSFDGQNVEINPETGGEILLKVAGANVLRLSGTYMWGMTNSSWQSVHPNTNCGHLLGTSTGPKYWWYVNCGTINDGNCSIYEEPKNAFNVLTTLKHTLKAGAPKGKIDSKNYPGPMKAWNVEKKEPAPHGRNLSAVIDHLIFAMGDIEDLITGLETRLKVLETGNN